MAKIISSTIDIKKLTEMTKLADKDRVKGPIQTFYYLRDQNETHKLFKRPNMQFSLTITNTFYEKMSQ